MIDSRINADTEVCFRSDSARSLSRRSSVTRVGGRYTDLVGLVAMLAPGETRFRQAARRDNLTVAIDEQAATRIIPRVLFGCFHCIAFAVTFYCLIVAGIAYKNSDLIFVFHFVASAYGRHLFEIARVQRIDSIGLLIPASEAVAFAVNGIFCHILEIADNVTGTCFNKRGSLVQDRARLISIGGKTESRDFVQGCVDAGNNIRGKFDLFLAGGRCWFSGSGRLFDGYSHLLTSTFGRPLFDDLNISQCDVFVKGKSAEKGEFFC